MRSHRKSCQCPRCKVKYQTWVDLSGPHECFNEFGFTNWSAPVYLEACTVCKQKDKK